MNFKLLLVGCGKMGGAMLEGWLARGLAPDRVRVVDPALVPSDGDGRFAGVRVVPNREDLDSEFAPDVIVLAVKPQTMAATAPAYRDLVGDHAVVLSIAAGQTLSTLARHVGDGSAIVRAMPNTPAAVGRGISVCCPNGRVDAGQRDMCDALMAAVGEVAWTEDEALMDAVTGVSGSGPAYVFLMIECLAAAGVEAGLPPDLATRLARATVSGAGELVRLSGEDAAQLRVNVTSPNGTTQAALDVLMAVDGLQPLMARAVAAATRRSRELAD